MLNRVFVRWDFELLTCLLDEFEHLYIQHLDNPVIETFEVHEDIS